ncbi:MAG: hypothetical protein ACR2O4_14890 [Hyphomicrobiaceae bacterium]
MAKIIAVHGTFAHMDITAPGTDEEFGPPALQWWQAGSPFEREIEALVADGNGNGPVDVFPFVWSGENSERERREASERLLDVLEELESRNEPYCVIGHSHGGSVIANALMRATSQKMTLPALKRWITVGTPFVDLQKERFLFSRLPLLLKSIFVASLMLLFMFIVSVLTDIINGGSPFENTTTAVQFGTSLVLTALPFVIFLVLARIHERRRLFFYRPVNIRKARDAFADRWLSLSHEDDEVVNGLGSLRSVNLNVFQEDFAVSPLTLGAVFLLPLAYLALVTSPAPMVGIADFLKTKVYAVAELERTGEAYVTDRRGLRSIRQRMREAQGKISDPNSDLATKSDGRVEIDNLRRDLRSKRRTLRVKHPDFQKKERALRFKRRFFQHKGQDCKDGKLCFEGRSIRLNSKLLFHLVTDEVARFIVDDDLRSRTVTGLLRYVLPIILVPVVFGLLAAGLVLLAQFIAGFVSEHASRWLDRLTWQQIRRTVLGNDTESEVALGANLRPFWIDRPRPFLPTEIGNLITEHSNRITAASLAKFRNAISELAFADRGDDDDPSALSYLTWQELVHASYFEVEAFRKMVALAISQQDGFQPSDALSNDPDYARLMTWLAGLKPGSGEPA